MKDVDSEFCKNVSQQ